MSGHKRVNRVADMLQKLIAEQLLREVQDPRLKMVSISAVEVSRDLAHAKVFYSVLGDAGDIAAAEVGLNKAKGFLRKQVASNSHLRVTPELHFVYDDSIRHGSYMDQLIHRAVSEDHEKQSKRGNDESGDNDPGDNT